MAFYVRPVDRRSILTSVASICGLQAARAAAGDSTEAVTPESFGARGDGVADDSAACQEAIDSGRNVIMRARYRVSRTLEMKAPRSTVSGSGQLIATRALAEAPLLHVNADDCCVDSIHLVNPTESQSQTGGKNIGIEVTADRCRILRNTIDRFQNGVTVSAFGEFFDTLIDSNIVSNVIGAGDGASDRKSSFGEDRGDGIVSWGSRTRILRNTVYAKPGTDARIGIHVEALGDFRRRPRSADDDSGAEILHNKVSGSFRRGIVNEAVRDVLIAFNDLPGGYTWWAIAVVQGASDTIVENNSVVFDRDPANATGTAWAPSCAAIQVAGYGPGVGLHDIVIRNNHILSTRENGPAIQFLNWDGDENNYRDIRAYGNIIRSLVRTRYRSIESFRVNLSDRTAANEVAGLWAG